jgi:hypothetical protein
MKIKLTVGVFIGFIAITLFIFFAAIVAVIDYRVTSKLDGVLWTIPAKFTPGHWSWLRVLNLIKII